MVPELDLARLPKIELHVHLDTSLSFGTVKSLVPGITEDEYLRHYVAPARCRDLHEFLGYTESSIALLQTAEALDLALRWLLAELAADGVIYAEIRFAPLLHTRAGLTAEMIAETACSALAAGMAETPIQARLIFCTLRQFSEAQSMETLQLALQYRSRGVVGFDLAGDEAGFPLDAHIRAFEEAAHAGLPATAHAGEALGPESVLDTLIHLRPRRIGHGVRSAEDPGLLLHLVREGIHLEVCPSSNIQTGVFPDMAAHSLAGLCQAGVSLSLNTDGRGLTRTTLTAEYRAVQHTFHWSKADFYRVNCRALQAAFCDNPTRDVLLAKLTSAYLS